MLSNDSFERIAHLLSVDDFAELNHAHIWRAILSLIEDTKPADVLSVAERLRERDLLTNVGGLSYLHQLATGTPGAANIARYAEIVRERSVRRKMIDLADWVRMKALAADGLSVKEKLDELQAKVMELSTAQSKSESGPRRIGDVLPQIMTRLDDLHRAGGAPVVGIATGFVDLDELTCGMEPGNLILLGARPSMGKSALAVNIAEHITMVTKLPALMFSLEMTEYELGLRLLSSQARLHMQRVRTGRLYGDDWERLGPALSRLNDAQLYIDETGDLSTLDIRARSRRLFRELGGLGLIIVDYVQLVRPDRAGDTRAIDVGEASRGLKALAKELGVPVLALSQLNRGLENRPNKRPLMSDMRDSGSLEQDADMIWFIYRDEVYHKESPDKGKAEIIVAKQRNGPIGEVSLTFIQASTRFENYARPPIDYRRGRDAE